MQDSVNDICGLLSVQLIDITSKLEILEIQKNNFPKELNYQIQRFCNMFKKYSQKLTDSNNICQQSQNDKTLNQNQAIFCQQTCLNLKQLKKIFSQLQIQVLLGRKLKSSQYSRNILNPQKICQYLKISKQNLKKVYSIYQIQQKNIQKLVKMIKFQADLLKRTRKAFEIQENLLQKIFQEIDFFGNKYIDYDSLVQFLMHYEKHSLKLSVKKHYTQSPSYQSIHNVLPQEQAKKSISQIGCKMLINIIKGFENSQKIFFQDLVQFVQNPEQNIQQIQQRNENEFKNDNMNYIPLNFSLNSLQSFDKPLIGHIKKNSRIIIQQKDYMYSKKNSRQKLSLQNSQIQSQQNDHIIDFSLSPSLSRRSLYGSKKFKKDDDKNKIKVEINELQNSLSLIKNNKIKDQSSNILVQQQYNVIKSSNSKKYLSHSQKIQIPTFQYISQNIKNNFQLKFEDKIIKSHTRNKNYVKQIKLGQHIKPYEVEQISSFHHRMCLQNKFSQLQTKKKQIIYGMQQLAHQYFLWYQAIIDLIDHNQKFTFINGWNVIDYLQKNSIELFKFQQFIKDCGIQKRQKKIHHFFNKFSKQRLIKQSNQKNNKKMIFSDYMKIFLLNSSISTIVKCKSRKVQVFQKWDQNLKKNYINFFRIVIDVVQKINILKNRLLQIHKQIKQNLNILNQSEIFQKVFGQQIVNFQDFQIILGGKESRILLKQISINDQYVDQEKFNIFLNEIKINNL